MMPLKNFSQKTNALKNNKKNKEIKLKKLRIVSSVILQINFYCFFIRGDAPIDKIAQII